MSLGRGFSIPQDNRVLQNGNFWVPATPEKSVVQRPNYPQAEMQQNQVGAENWQNLLGIYTQLLQDEPSNLPPQKFNVNHREPPIKEVAPVEICNSRLSQNFRVEQNHRDPRIRDVTSIGTHNRPPQNFYQTVQDVVPLEKLRNFSQNVGHIGSCVPNLGNTVPPRKVNSLADLMGGMKSSLHAPMTNGEPCRSINVRGKPENILRRSQVESNEMAYKSACAIVQPDHILHTKHNLGDYSRQQIPNTISPASNENNPNYIKNKVPGNLLFQEASRLDANSQGRPSVPHYTNYNLNLPPIAETEEPSSAARPFQLAPETPDHQKQPRNYQIIQEPQLCNAFSNQEKHLHGDGFLSQQPEIIEINHNEFMQNVLGSSSASISPSPNEKNNFHNINDGGIDLNKTPQLKPPKRRKHRPKVVKEGKPKKTPKPVVTKNNTPDGTPTGKRKYVRKKGTETLKTPLTDEVKVSDAMSSEKSCRRQLNFDLEKGVENESQGKEFDYQERYNEGIKVPFNLNLNYHDEPSRLAVKQQTENLFNCADLVKQNPSQELVAFTVPSPAPKVHTLNVIARYLNARNANINGGGISQIVIQENSNEPNLDGRRQPMLHTEPQLQENLVNTTEKQGFKRDFSHTELAHPHTITLMGSQLWSNGVSKMDRYPGHNNSNVQQNCSGVKKSRVGNFSGTSSSMKSGITTVQDCSGTGTIENQGNKSFHAPSSTVSRKSGLSNSGKEICITSSESNKVALDWYLNARTLFHKFQQQNASSQVHQCAEKNGQKKSHCFSETQITNSFSTVTDCYQESVSKRGLKVTHGNELVNSHVRESSTKFSSMDRFPLEETKYSRGSSTKVKGSKEKKKKLFSVEDITYGMKELNIGMETGALVPYGGDRAIVAYDPIKRRKPRPKVDLDPETNRLWNLLMGKEGSESTDTNKEKWWEEERKVFRGRVDSFIARMHLVQGDRRFSKWKGSVVDSVIGVFLTQNVSDHLSSSAFMSLAAKFPLKPTQQFCQNKESSLCEQQKVRVTYPDGTVTELINNPVQKEEDILSSQSSSESVIFQASADVRYSPGSNSEAEDQLIGWNFNKNSCTLNLAEHAGRISSSQQHQFRDMGSLFPDNRSFIGHQQLENQVYGQYSYPFTSNVPPVTPSTRSWLNLSMESTFLVDSTRPAEILNKEPSSNVQKYTGKCINNRVNNAANNLEQCENVNFGPNKMGQVHSSGEVSSNIGKTTSNVRKRKAEKEKVEPFNWDTLREQVQMKKEKRGMGMNPMDSLDYETLRNADVREISDTIKERGMNNMLAERMKDFLNRIVQDHGKIDLEWLRDVQPDKVKDYLLSIRGLGLKSVECVRLLTLHHLAFPVDTNVGRIAVRLGWVPLQPLPESLQLHLLEMYPVLESIQKYLWPRLCKLDQETLYELHYQMITFGKVFCTKREPNCNACPMRGECRHFASAFASARLALPGPEEKRIVNSSARTSTKYSPEVISKPVPLLPPGDNLERQTGFTRNCEPIIEEPTSPEAQTEMLERDIEDAFYEDPDEIPVIKLNIEEFTTNLQNFMQDHLEMQEFDMSKALVALSPELASIPTPKLKHISRLRTEHQVYELPDLHPLLEGLDRRETDDPSPYLLAIWTPGETADSVQPPESNCCYQEGGGQCNMKTCFSCNSTRETQAQTIRGTILVPCRTAMRGSFPLNGTYFQVNEVFADHESSINPIDVPRNLLWNLPRRTVFFGTSVSTIFKGLSTEDIQYCFWKGFVCVRGFDRETRAPRPLRARLHFPASKMTKQNEQRKRNAAEQV